MANNLIDLDDYVPDEQEEEEQESRGRQPGFLYPTYKQQMREASASDFVVHGEVARGPQRVHQPGVPYPYKRQVREASAIPIVSAVAVEDSVEGGDEELRRRYEEERLRRQQAEAKAEQERAERERAEAERERERANAERAEAELQRRKPEKEEEEIPAMDTSPKDKPAQITYDSNQGKRSIVAGVVVVGLIIATVVGVCLSGNCSPSSNEGTTSSLAPPTISPAPSISVVPSSIPTFPPTLSPTSTLAPTKRPIIVPPTPAPQLPTFRPVVAPTLRPIVAPVEQAVVAPTRSPVVAPTRQPVVSPTRQPVVSPTSRPVVAQTSRPVPSPTRRPVVSPTSLPLAAPTPSNTDRATIILGVLNSITLTSRVLSYPSQATPGERAVQWLIDDDLTTNPSDTLAIRQRFALATMWFANGPFSDLVDNHSDTWLSSTGECEWTNVQTCVNGKVTWLELDLERLSGSIPVDIGLLTALTRLELNNNQLSGTIPTQIGLLTALTGLYLYSNNFLSGTIPTQIGELTALTDLWLTLNQLSGMIPTEILSLTSLKSFFVSRNDLTGSMPFCDGDSSRIEFVWSDCQEVDCPCCTLCCTDGASPRCVDL